MEQSPTFQYVKLFAENFSLWPWIVLIGLIWLLRNPQSLAAIPKYVQSARFGDFEVTLHKLEEKLAETETHVAELEQENARLNTLYAAFDAHAPAAQMDGVRQSLKAVAGSLDDPAPLLEGLAPGADHADVYAAAEILRARRDPAMFDPLIDCVARIAADPQLEGLRFHTVWTLASAVHRTVLADVKHKDMPALGRDQLTRARAAMTALAANPHVQQDRPDAPDAGIRGPARHALNWIDRGLAKPAS